MRVWPFALSILLLAVRPLAQQPAPAPPLVRENATIKISPHVYVIPDGHVPLVPNVGIIVGSTGTLVVDTGLGPRNAETVLREVAKVSRTRDLYLVATHFHPEHVAGSSAFPPGTRFIVARAEQQDLDELGAGMMATFSRMSALHAELLKDVQFRKADVLFDRDYAVDLGGLQVRLLALGPTHTRGDTAIFVAEDRVLFAGDIVLKQAFLAFGQQSSAAAWVAALDALDALHPTAVVPSHFDLADDSVIALQRSVIQAMQARVRDLKAQGRTVDETAQTLTSEFTAKYPDWMAPTRIAAAARTIYAETR